MKQHSFKIIVLILALALVASNVQAQKTVTGISLKAFNNTGQACVLKIYMQTQPTESPNKTFVTQSSIAKDEAMKEISLPGVAEKSFLCIYAELSNGGRSKTEYYPIKKNTKNIATPIDIPNGKTLGGSSFEDIKESMKYEPEKFKITDNYPLADLFNGYFGGLVIYKEDSTKTKIKQIITPTELGTRIDTKFGTYSTTQTTVVSREQGATAKLSIPAIASASFDFNSADLFKLEIQYRGAGPILWTPTSEMSDVPSKFKELSESKLQVIGALYDQDSTLKLSQIDNAYVYEAILFDLIKYNKLSQNTEVNGSIYFTATGNYSRHNEDTQKQIFGSFMLGAWWNNDYTPLLKYAQKLYLEDKAKQIREQKSKTGYEAIYNSLRENNSELPELSEKTMKQRYIDEINKLIKNIKVNEDDIKIHIETPN